MNPRLQQILIAAGVAAVLFIGFKFMRNPYSAQERAVAQKVADIKGTWDLGESRPSDPPPVQAQRILDREDLWQGLVEPPKPAERALDVDAILRGIVPTSRTQGVGKDMRARIRTPRDPRGEYYGAGDAIAGTQGIIVEEVTRDSVVFLIKHKGQEHRRRVPR